MMSKLAMIDSGEATTLLTSIINGFQMKTEDAMLSLDKLNLIEDNSATTVKELASGMQRSANSAQLAKVSFDELASYIKLSVLI